MTRSPLSDPQPGDVVRTEDGRERRVGKVFRDPLRLTWISGKRQGACFPESWRSWCKRNRVVVVEVGR